MEIGEPIDQGRFGLLSQDDSGHLLCHVCGRGLLHLGTHARRAHGLSADDYRERYGLTSGTRLVAERVRELMSQKWLARQGEHLARLEAHRDPVAASRAARGSEAFSRVQYRLLRAEVPRRAQKELSKEHRSLLEDQTDLRAWSLLVRQVIREHGYSVGAVARAFGLKRVTVESRLRYFAPKPGNQDSHPQFKDSPSRGEEVAPASLPFEG